jgi:hypothetical protein
VKTHHFMTFFCELKLGIIGVNDEIFRKIWAKFKQNLLTFK